MGFLDVIAPIAGTAIGTAIGGPAGGAIGGQLASGLFGMHSGQATADQYGQQILNESRRLTNVSHPLFGRSIYDPESNTLDLAMSDALGGDWGQLRGLRGGMFGLLQDPNFVRSEVDRLRGIAQPREDALRQSLRSEVFNRGRLGVGVGGGRGSNFYNPELAALEEAFAQADAQRVGQARGEQQRLLSNVFGLLGAEQDLLRSPLELANLSLSGRTTEAGLSGLGAAAQRASNANDAFFGSLGQTLGGLDFGEIFGGGLFGGERNPAPVVSGPYSNTNRAYQVDSGFF